MLPDVLLTILGWVLLAAAIIAAAWFAAGDRLRHGQARRCPKCWYDLPHTPGLTCSECGYTARREAQLHRARRNKRWLLAGVGLSILAHGSFRTTAIRNRGWIAAIPTVPLVIAVPRMEAFVDDGESGSIWGNPGTGSLRFLLELEHRIAAGELSQWQRALLLESALASLERRPLLTSAYEQTAVARRLLTNLLGQRPCEPSSYLSRSLLLPAISMRTRARWPQGEPIHATYDIRVPPGAIAVRCIARPLTAGLAELFMSAGNAWLSEDGTYVVQFPTYGWGWWFDRSVPIGTVERTEPRLSYEYRFECNYEQERNKGDVILFARHIDIPCEIVASIDDVVKPVESKDFAAALTNTLKPMLIPGGVSLNMDDLDEAFCYLDGATLAVVIEVVSGESVVAKGEAWWAAPGSAESRTGRTKRSPIRVRLDQPDGGWPPPKFAAGEYRLRLTSSQSLALRDFESNRYWKGQVEMPAHAVEEGSSD